MIKEKIEVVSPNHLYPVLCLGCDGEKNIKTENGEETIPCPLCNGHGFLLSIPRFAEWFHKN